MGTREIGERRERVVGLRNLASGLEHALGDGVVRVGAGTGCELVVPDPFASHVHCTLERHDGRVLVRDRGSKNGTLLGGQRVEVAEVGPGALLTVGKTVFVAVGPRDRPRPPALEALRGRDPGFRAAVARAVRAAATSASVLVLGETGTGKELIARAVHDASPRAAGPFVALNCGAIPGELIEAELFGHERGAFTGADRPRDGVFIQAEGGTLFLDELGELPRSQQPRLLRALETRSVRRVGASAERPVDLRLVAATNRLDLGAPDAALREDLYHRIATVVIELPPLRARRGDIPDLVHGFLAELEPEFGGRTVSPATLAAMVGHAWPGNIRQLRQAIHRAVALSTHELRLDDLLPGGARLPPAAPAPLALVALEDAPTSAWSRAQRGLLADSLARHGTMRAAARSLGMAKSTFADRARRLGLK